MKATREGAEQLTSALNKVAHPRVMSKRAKAKARREGCGNGEHNKRPVDGRGGAVLISAGSRDAGSSLVSDDLQQGRIDLNQERKEDSDGVDCAGSESRDVDCPSDRAVVDHTRGQDPPRRGAKSSLRIG